MKGKDMRLDQFLTAQGFAPTRQKAVYLIEEGMVFVDGKQAAKPSLETEGKKIEVIGEGLRYVGRGALKLEGALRVFSVDPTGLVCLDVGASTGGFTDCLLQHGARIVYALDVGHGQLDAKLLADRRVVNMEGLNARAINEETLSEKVDLIVSDLSFISQKLVHLPLKSVIKDNGMFISLIKPQFECGKKDVGKKGIVKSPIVHERVINEVIASARVAGWSIKDIAPSPIQGGDGNKEYLALFINASAQEISQGEIKKAVFGN